MQARYGLLPVVSVNAAPLPNRLACQGGFWYVMLDAGA